MSKSKSGTCRCLPWGGRASASGPSAPVARRSMSRRQRRSTGMRIHARFMWCILTRGEVYATTHSLFDCRARAGRGARDASAQTPVSAPDRRRLQARAELADAAARRFLRLEERRRRRRRSAKRKPRRAARPGGAGNAPRPAGQGPTNQPGISGLAIDQNDRIYVFNRGAKPVMVFDTDGKLVASGGDQELNGKKLDPELAALGRGRLGRQRLHDRARRASHRQAQPEDGQVPAAARHDDARRATTRRISICRQALPSSRTATSSSPTATAITAS